MNKSLRKYSNNSKGITLVALIITIVIIIILASVTISATFGENGIIRRAELARDLTANSITKENEDMNRVMDEYDDIMNGDRISPIVRIEVGETTETSIAITVNATDDSGEIASYKYYINGTLKDTLTTNVYTFNGLTEGTEYDIKVEAFDNAGNKGENSTKVKTKEKEEWSYDEEGNITNGEVTVEIGDYVNYNCKTGKSVTSYTAQNGYGDQTFTTDSYNYGWRVLGVNEETGELLIISEELIGPATGGGTNGNRTTYYLKGQEGYVNGENELNKISEIYGKGEGATGARSIKVEDINKITGYNPNNVGVYDPEQTGSGEKCYKGSIYEYGNKVTYTRNSSSQVQSSGTNRQSGTGSYSQFTYYTGSEWKSLNVGESATLTSSYYLYYPDTLTTSSSGSTVGIAKTSKAYKMLFTNSSTGANTSQSGTTSGFYYWLGSPCVYANTGYARFRMRYVYSGRVYNYYLYDSSGSTFNPSYGVRPVVSLQSGISLKNSTTQKDGCTLWNIV